MASCIILLFALLFLCGTSSVKVLLNNVGGTDLTLVSGSIGEIVVDACIQKINSAAGIGTLLSNDFGFLKRLALVESNFGDSPANPLGGIWQIESWMINIIHSYWYNPLISSLVNIFSADFPSYVLNFTDPDFSVPLKSAVAARLYFEIVVSNRGSTPISVSDQASCWITDYNTNGSTTYFITTVEDFKNITRCKVSRLDLWFLIDGSSSVGSSNFLQCLDFVEQTSLSFNISSDNVRTGLMIYAGSTAVRSYLNQHQSNSLFSSVVMSTPYPGGGTLTGYAISQIDQYGFSVSNGARPENEGVPRILVVLTDGRSGDDVLAPSTNIKDNGVTVFGVGVGSGYDQNEINEIASFPPSEYAYEISQFSALATVLRDRVAEQACTASALIPNDTEICLVVEGNTTMYSHIPVPINGSVELRYDAASTASTGIVYLSEVIQNPNAAFNDAFFYVHLGVTVVCYNVVGSSSGGSGQAGSGGTINLYISFEAEGTQPIDVKFRAAISDKPANPAPIKKKDKCC